MKVSFQNKQLFDAVFVLVEKTASGSAPESFIQSHVRELAVQNGLTIFTVIKAFSVVKCD